MAKHTTGTREQWLAARLELLKAEKELTRQSDALARQRRELPWVRIDKPYRFETEQGAASLADLFRGRSQLLVYHFMFGPDYKAGCPSCSSIADGFNGIAVHLANHDVMLWAVSRTPLAKLHAYKRAWDGLSPVRPPWAAISTTTSALLTLRSNSARAVSNTTTAARRRCVHADGKERRSRARRPMGHPCTLLRAERMPRRSPAAPR